MTTPFILHEKSGELENSNSPQHNLVTLIKTMQIYRKGFHQL